MQANHSTSGSGIELDNSTAATALPVTLNQVNLIDNFGSGGAIKSKGTITLNAIHADDNDLSGLIADNAVFAATGSITVLSTYGENSFSHNHGSGLEITTQKTTRISQADILDNGGNGLSIIGSGPTSSITITNLTTELNSEAGVLITTNGVVNLAQIVSFGNFAGAGISITTNAPVYLKNITANSNGLDGLFIDTASTFTLAGTLNQFNDNGQVELSEGNGIKIQADGSSYLTNLVSNHNDGYGIQITNSTPGNVTINATVFGWKNQVTENLDGINISVGGAVNINKSLVNLN